MPLLRTCPITSACQLRTELTYLRQCHADETTTLLARIDPAIFTSSDREAIMQPMILGMLEKQLKTDYLSSAMRTACPVGNREADEILQTLHKPWLEDKNNRTEEMVKDLKNAIDTAYQDLGQEHTQQILKKQTRPWTVRELSILYALYPIIDHDYESYLPILPGRTALQVSTKIQHEYSRGHLGQHAANDHYKQAKAIDYEAFYGTANRLGLISDRKAKRLKLKDAEWQPQDKNQLASMPAESTIIESMPNDIPSALPKATSRVGRHRKSDLANSAKEGMISTDATSSRRVGRPRMSNLTDARKDETIPSKTASTLRVRRPRKSDMTDPHKEGTISTETTSPRRVGRPRKINLEIAQKEEIKVVESISPRRVGRPRKLENDDTQEEQPGSTISTSPRGRGRSNRVDHGKIQKMQKLPVSSHSGKTTEDKKRGTRNITAANSPPTESQPFSSCIAF